MREVYARASLKIAETWIKIKINCKILYFCQPGWQRCCCPRGWQPSTCSKTWPWDPVQSWIRCWQKSQGFPWRSYQKVETSATGVGMDVAAQHSLPPCHKSRPGSRDLQFLWSKWMKQCLVEVNLTLKSHKIATNRAPYNRQRKSALEGSFPGGVLPRAGRSRRGTTTWDIL